MSTKDNSKKKQNKGFIALLVEKARKIFDTDEEKQEESKKTNSIKKATSKPRSSVGKHSATTKRSSAKSIVASKTSSASKKTTTKATTAKTTKSIKTEKKSEVDEKDFISKLVEEEKLFDNTPALSVEEKDNKENTVEKIEPKTKEKLNVKSIIKENVNDKNKGKENIKEIEKENVKENEKTDSERVKILEYYDLPFRYNKTVVKVLAQTPNRLFIYWDVSDEDKQALVDKFGPYFYNNTKPVLIVHNKTMNYSFEVDINDYANSWYLHVNDSKCDYDVELGRRSINKYAQTPDGYLEISHSNSIESPNDHILFDELGKSVVFENIKTTKKYEKDITSASFLRRLGELLNVKGLYDHLYQGEVINNNIDLNNPTS